MTFRPTTTQLFEGTHSGGDDSNMFSAADIAGVIISSSTPLSIYGASGASDQTLVSYTIPAGTIAPNSILELDLLAKFVTGQSGGGRTVKVQLGGQTLVQTFPVNGITSLNAKALFFVGPDLQTVYAFSQNMNDVSAPTAGQGAPFSVASAHSTSAISIDLTADQTFVISMKPINNDTAELTGFCLRNVVYEYAPSTKIHTSSAVGCWGDSMTAGTGSVSSSGFVLTTTGDLNSNTTISTVPTTTGLIAGQVITGTGIPADTTVVSFVANTSITISNAATVTNTGVAIKVVGGPYPEQLKFASAGRPVWNSGIGALTSTQILALMLRDKVRGRLWTNIIWVGRNDVGAANLTTKVMNNIAAAIANMATGSKFIVCTVTPLITETTGTTQAIAINALNAQIIATYPNNYVDVNALLCTQGDGTVNTLYRATGGDTVHLNDLGYAKVAAAIQTKLTAMGA